MGLKASTREASVADLPTTPGGFRIIAADVPWRFASNSEANPGRNAMRHYSCMTLDKIKALPVADVAAKDAALFFWVTGPFLAIGAHIPIMKAWGFKPTATAFTWIKLNKSAPTLFLPDDDVFMGGGFTTRKNAEFVILGKRGKSVREDAGIREVIHERIREHSRKPEEFYRRVERYGSGPRLDLFARAARPGWTVWGNEADKFTEIA